MPKVSEIVEPYFSHDMNAKGDDKILKMFFSFRKLAKEMTREELESFVSHGAYGLFWEIIEYMHRNELKTDDLELLSDEFRVSEKFIQVIFDNFNLFRKEDEKYISDRILRNISKQEEVSNRNKAAVQRRWQLSDLRKIYEEVFGKKPVLSKDDTAKYLEYENTIDDLKDKLPDILYTLKELKFEDKPKFNPNINWLLTENHLPKLLNGEYGKLKNWKKHKEFLAEQEKQKQRQGLETESNAKEESELLSAINSIDSKFDAIKLIASRARFIKNRLCIYIPELKDLQKKFDITDQEIKEWKRNNEQG